MYSNAKMEFLKKPVGQQWYPNQLYGSPPHIMYTFRHGNPLITDADKHPLRLGVTLAQLVKASVGQADVQRFEPHIKSRHFGLPLAQTIRPNWQFISAGGSVAIQTWSIYKVYT